MTTWASDYSIESSSTVATEVNPCPFGWMDGRTAAPQLEEFLFYFEKELTCIFWKKFRSSCSEKGIQNLSYHTRFIEPIEFAE